MILVIIIIRGIIGFKTIRDYEGDNKADKLKGSLDPEN